MRKSMLTKSAAAAFLALALTACGEKEGRSLPSEEVTEAVETETETETETEPEEETLSPEDMDLVKYNYYVDLNNDIFEVIDSIGYYFEVVGREEEFSLLPDTGLTYGYRVYGKNTDIVDDCLMLADMEPAYEELDPLVKEIADPLRDIMTTFSDVSDSYDYADNQYQKAKEYHAVIYASADKVIDLGYKFMDAIAQMGAERTAQEEQKFLDEGRLIIYNASHALTIARQVLDVIDAQEITDENITELDLTEIRPLYDELLKVVADFDAATSDNDQLMKESISNSRPFDGLYDGLAQALEWMMKQVDSGRPLDLSGSGAPLGSIGHFSECMDKCIDRYNSVFVE